MSTLLKKLEKFDYVIIFIIICAVIFGIQQVLLKQAIPKMNERLTVVVNVPLEENVLENINYSSVNNLYFDQSRQTSDVSKIEKVSRGINIYLVGPGNADGRYIFAGRTINLNDRIKLTGGISGDGFIVKIDKTDDD